MTTKDKSKQKSAVSTSKDFVTFVIAGQTFGIPVDTVQDVFAPQAITRVPLAPPEVGGILNLRGRILTAIDMRRRLGLPPREDTGPSMAVGIEKGGENYGLIIDRVGEVLSLDESNFEPNPDNLTGRLRDVSLGIYRLESSLLIVLDVNLILDFARKSDAA